jgi:5-methylcytosine-specific restriction endonuclease McrA
MNAEKMLDRHERREYRRHLWQQSPRCRYCRKPLPRLGLTTLDHLLPRSAGGQDVASNLTLACRDCNQSKGDRTPDALLVWASRIALFAGLPVAEGGER